MSTDPAIRTKGHALADRSEWTNMTSGANFDTGLDDELVLALEGRVEEHHRFLLVGAADPPVDHL
jgi:hypothetical protein